MKFYFNWLFALWTFSFMSVKFRLLWAQTILRPSWYFHNKLVFLENTNFFFLFVLFSLLFFLMLPYLSRFCWGSIQWVNLTRSFPIGPKLMKPPRKWLPYTAGMLTTNNNRLSLGDLMMNIGNSSFNDAETNKKDQFVCKESKYYFIYSIDWLIDWLVD